MSIGFIFTNKIMVFIFILLLVSYAAYFFTLKRIYRFESFYSILLPYEPKYYFYVVLFFSGSCALIYYSLPVAKTLWPLIFLNAAIFFSIRALYFSPINFLYKVCLVAGNMAILLLFAIIAVLIFILFSKSWQFFHLVAFSNFWSTNWNPQLESFGVLPIIWGSLFITLLALIIAIPIAVLATTYIYEYLPLKCKGFFENFIDILIAMPTIVYGYFAAIYLGPHIKQWCEAYNISASAESSLGASIVIGIMIIPFISLTLSQALKAIPAEMKEASFALGGTKSQTIIHLVWPYIMPALMRGIIFAFSRAIGETMIVAMATGLVANISLNPLKPTTSLTIQIMHLLTGDQDINSVYSLAAFALSLILFIVTFMINNVGNYIIKHKASVYV